MLLYIHKFVVNNYIHTYIIKFIEEDKLKTGI